MLYIVVILIDKLICITLWSRILSARATETQYVHYMNTSSTEQAQNSGETMTTVHFLSLQLFFVLFLSPAGSLMDDGE